MAHMNYLLSRLLKKLLQILNQQVLMFHRNGQQSAELRLHPQELGALQITLQLDDKQAQLHIASAHGQVRAAVEAAMP